MTESKQRVLILCTGNSARSQMAEGWLRNLAGDHFEIFSAGNQPTGQVHPAAIQAMAEIGIDIKGQSSKHVSQFAGQVFDYVVTVCDSAAEQCPIFPGKAIRIHRDFADPAKAPVEEQRETFRRVRDELSAWLSQTFPCSRKLRVLLLARRRCSSWNCDTLGLSVLQRELAIDAN